MTNPGQVSRLYYSAEHTVDETLFEPPPGSHFSEICDASVGIFIPLLGVRTTLSGSAISPTESLGTLSVATWRSLENRRYKDLFQGSVVLQPRAYYIRLFPERESEYATEAFALALMQTGTPEHAEMVVRLEALAVALVTGESGGLISPLRVPWTVTHGFMRRRLRSNRLRFYSWTMRDNYRPLVERVRAGESEECNEFPTMIFSAPSLALDASLTEHVAAVLRMIEEHCIFSKVPGLHEVARRYVRSSDPSNSQSMRLLEVVTAFELVFGRLSPEHERGTMARLHALMRDADVDIPDPALLRSFRNAIAHGRTNDENVGAVFGDLDLALRMFILRAISEAANDATDLPSPRKAFEALKEIVFAA
jgi:hypothetical protein